MLCLIFMSVIDFTLYKKLDFFIFKKYMDRKLRDPRLKPRISGSGDAIFATHLILSEVFHVTLEYGLAAQIHCHVLYGASKYRMEVARALCCQFQALNRVKWSIPCHLAL
jgi:hypothetical protein